MIRTALLPLSMALALSGCAQNVQNDNGGDAPGGQSGASNDPAGAAADASAAAPSADVPADPSASATTPGGGASAGSAPPAAAAPEDPQIRVAPGLEQSCDAAPAQHLVGRSSSDADVKNAMTLTGAKTVRVIPHDGMVTMDYRGDRLNIQLDAQGKIVAISCG